MNTAMRLTNQEHSELISLLYNRFVKNSHRHRELDWPSIQQKLEAQPKKMWSLNQMETTGGEPDVLTFDKSTGEFLFCDYSAESPVGRRSLCYDSHALASRKENKPSGSALGLATEMGINILTAEQYHLLQQVGPFDTKTSSWLATPQSIRNLGGAIFGDYRYGQAFVYHNGAESYYAARGFRGCISV